MSLEAPIPDKSAYRALIPRDRRFRANVWARVRQVGRAGLTVRLSNVSRTGCLLECMAQLDPDLPLSIKVGDQPSLSGKIVWTQVGACGCQFDRRLEDNELAQLLWSAQNKGTTA